jgi:hypothetical protein
MRPPILQWKVSLALIAVVIVGAVLGSVLHSTTPSHENRAYAVSVFRRATPDAAMRTGPASISQCIAFEATLRTAPRAEKHSLRMLMRRVCHTRR